MRNVTISVPADAGWSSAGAVRSLPTTANVVPQRAADGSMQWRVSLQANTSVVLFTAAAAGPPFVVRPIPSNQSEEHWFGYNRPFPPQK